MCQKAPFRQYDAAEQQVRFGIQICLNSCVTHLKSHFYLLYVHDTVLTPDLGVQVGIVIVRYVKKLLFVKNPGTFVGYGPCLH